MKWLVRWFQGVDREVAVPMLYAGVVLTLFEYRLLPSALFPVVREAWPELTRAELSLASSMVWAGACCVLFLGVPLLLTVGVHRLKPRDIGWSVKGFFRHLPIYLGLYVFMLPFILWAAQDPDFLATYPFVRSARTDMDHFWRWELAYICQFVALESFFRGYLLFTLARRMGANAVFVVAVPYTMIHFHKPEAECLGALFAGVALGALALRFRSFLGGAILHILVALTMDYLACREAGLF